MSERERERERLGERLIHQKERKEEGEEGQIYKNERKGEKEREKSKLSTPSDLHTAAVPHHIDFAAWNAAGTAVASDRPQKERYERRDTK